MRRGGEFRSVLPFVFSFVHSKADPQPPNRFPSFFPLKPRHHFPIPSTFSPGAYQAHSSNQHSPNRALLTCRPPTFSRTSFDRRHISRSHSDHSSEWRVVQPAEQTTRSLTSTERTPSRRLPARSRRTLLFQSIPQPRYLIRQRDPTHPRRQPVLWVVHSQLGSWAGRVRPNGRIDHHSYAILLDPELSNRYPSPVAH